MAVLEADVVGYSKLVARDEVATSRLLAESRGRFEEAAGKHRGRVAVQTGDAFLLTFPSALDAVQAAVMIHRRHRNRPLALRGGWRLEYRMGIDLGDVWEDEHGHLAGNVVNTAARLESMAMAGGICVSEVVHGQVQARAGLTFVDMGPLALKNLAAPVRAYQAAVYTPASPPVEYSSPKTPVTEKISAARPARARPLPSRAAASAAPPVRTTVSPQDWNGFVRKAFTLIQSRFKRRLSTLRSRRRKVEVNFEKVHARMFRCQVIVAGREQAAARIWLGRMGGEREQICYANQDVLLKGEDSWNIALNPARNRNTPALWVTGSPLGAHSGEYDLESLSPEDATEYLWRHFLHPFMVGAAGG